MREFALIVGLSFVACGPPSDAELETASTTQALSDYGGLGDSLWPRIGNAYPIHVCFRQLTVVGGTPTPSWAADKAQIENALTATWEASSAIDFIFEGDCPVPLAPSDWIPIGMIYNSANPQVFGGFGAAYRGARMGDYSDLQVRFTYGSARFEFETTGVHEMGHALGFEHERARPDFTGCTSLLDGSMVAAEPNPTIQLIGNRYDGASIMANWECDETRKHDSFSYFELSYLDRIGVSIVYPRSLTRYRGSMASTNGFQLSGALVVPTGALIRTDWTQMNAHSTVFAAAPYWFLSPLPLPIGSGFEFPVGNTVQTVSLKFQFNDRWGRTHTGYDMVDINPARHAALVAIINSAL